MIPPKGVHRSSNVEGGELLDCDGEELAIPTGTTVPEFSSDSGWFSFCLKFSLTTPFVSYSPNPTLHTSTRA